ncbi:hypothetical protein NST50_24635 [Paenibacillus sp. FSL E2-0202]|uniref:hypothetical protein n=1 Tax=unclassified Paenibacillus TaxID=185978 RepID=UPI0030EDDBB1
MFDLIGNLREFKNLTLLKLLIFSTFVLLLLVFVREFMPTLFIDFLETVSYFSKKLNYEKWKSVLPLIQILFGALVVMFTVAFIIALFLYEFYWKKQRNAPYLNGERTVWISIKFPSYLLLTALLYINLIGYFNILEIETLAYQAPIYISGIILIMTSLAGVAKLLQSTD